MAADEVTAVRIKATLCLYCGSVIEHTGVVDEAGLKAIRDAMEAHDLQCKHNPLVRALAAREAEVREAREALEHLLREWLAWRPGITGVARTRTEAILSRAPGGNEALRTLLRDALRRAHNAGWVHHQVGEAGRNVIGNDGWEDNDAIERSLLGPTGDGARKGDSDE